MEETPKKLVITEKMQKDAQEARNDLKLLPLFLISTILFYSTADMTNGYYWISLLITYLIIGLGDYKRIFALNKQKNIAYAKYLEEVKIIKQTRKKAKLLKKISSLEQEMKNE